MRNWQRVLESVITFELRFEEGDEGCEISKQKSNLHQDGLRTRTTWSLLTYVDNN